MRPNQQFISSLSTEPPIFDMSDVMTWFKFDIATSSAPPMNQFELTVVTQSGTIDPDVQCIISSYNFGTHSDGVLGDAYNSKWIELDEGDVGPPYIKSNQQNGLSTLVSISPPSSLFVGPRALYWSSYYNTDSNILFVYNVTNYNSSQSPSIEFLFYDYYNNSGYTGIECLQDRVNLVKVNSSNTVLDRQSITFSIPGHKIVTYDGSNLKVNGQSWSGLTNSTNYGISTSTFSNIEFHNSSNTIYGTVSVGELIYYNSTVWIPTAEDYLKSKWNISY